MALVDNVDSCKSNCWGNKACDLVAHF